jgi:hypothetical protein
MKKSKMSRLLDDPVALGEELVHKLRQSCEECREATDWPTSCAEHAPLIRAHVDASYLPWLRSELARTTERIEDINRAIEYQNRIEKGLELIQAGKVDAVKGAEQIGVLEEAKAEDDRSLDTESLLIRLHEYERNQVYWQRQLSRATTQKALPQL